MNPLLLKHNKTTKLIMPMAYYNKSIKGEEIISDENFKGAYIGHLDKPEWDDTIIIDHNGLFEVLEVPTEFEDDYWKIISSQYSQISDKYKDYLLAFWDEDLTSELYRVVNAEYIRSSDKEMTKGAIRSKIKELMKDFDLFDEIYNMRVS